MDASTTPRISLTLKPGTMMALAPHHAEDNEEVADPHLRAMRFFTFDLYPHETFDLVRTLITETTNEIRNFERREETSRIDTTPRPS